MSEPARPRPRPRRGRPGHDVNTVLAGSVAVFNERGFDGTSMEDLAQRLGISKSAIYHHVKSKDALLGLALDYALAGLETAVEQVEALQTPAIDRLEALLRASVLVLVQRLPYVTLLLRVRGNTEVEHEALKRRRAIDFLAADLVTEAIGNGDLRPGVDPLLAARLMFGMVNSMTEWLKADSRLDAEALAADVAGAALDGLRLRRAPDTN